MPELSNLLRQRLTSRAVPATHPELGLGAVGVHPDVDTLTAYTERLLPAGEREHVLEHLAVCGNCREIALLSLHALDVAAEAATVPVAKPAQRGWRLLWKSSWGLAASAAALVVVVGVLVEFPRTPTPFPRKVQEGRQMPPALTTPSPAAPTESTAFSAPPFFGNHAETTPPLAGIQPEASRRRETNLASAETRAPVRTSQPVLVDDVSRVASPAMATSAAPLGWATSAAGVVVPGQRRDYLNDRMFTTDARASDSNALPTNELPSAPAPRSSNQFPAGALLGSSSFPANSQLPEFAGMAATAASTKQARTFAPAGAGGHPLIGLSIFSHGARHVFQKRAGVGISSEALGFAMGGPGQLNSAVQKNQAIEVASAASPKTETELDQSHAFSRMARSEATDVSAEAAKKEHPGQLSWRIVNGILLKSGVAASWVEGYPSIEGIEFTTYTAHGTDVWAGGKDAALVHSHDGGSTWERVTLGASATGAITFIEARGLNVQVKSSSGQSWSSQDGGTSWTLRD